MNITAAISNKPWMLAIIVFALLAVWMGSGMFEKPEFTDEASQVQAASNTGGPVSVQVATLIAEPVARVVSVYGRTAPARQVEIAAETEGRVEIINAQRGLRLNKGQPILTLDLRDRQARVKQSEASVREHETAYRAQSSLQSDGYVSETQIAETLARLENARAELLRARIDLQNRIVRAPFNGVLQNREVEIGDFVRSGDPVATFVDNLNLIVTGTLAEQEVANIKVGETATAKLVTGQEVQGRIRYLSTVADRSTRTFAVEMEIDNAAGELPAGVTAEMLLESGEVMAYQLSPAMLTLDAEGDIGVMTVDANQRARFTPVVIEKSGTDGVWVSGLGDTASVITVGQGFVRPGQAVEIITPRGNSETALAAKSLQ
jgi:multidrug efflux system membrane fusion protein